MATLTEVSQEDKRIGGGYFRPQIQRNAIIRVTGSLTQEQIDALRADNRHVRLLFDNTTNITAEQVRALDQPNITFQVFSPLPSASGLFKATQ